MLFLTLMPKVTTLCIGDYETIQRRQLRPPDAGGIGEMKGGLP